MQVELLEMMERLADAQRYAVPSSFYLVGKASERLGLDWRDCAPTKRLKILHQLRDDGRDWIRVRANRLEAILYPDERSIFGDMRDKAGGFFDRMKLFIRNTALAGWLAMFGPGEVPQPAVITIQHQVDIQYGYLDRFRQEVLDEGKRFQPAQAEQYGGAVWGMTHNAIRQVIRTGRIFNFEHRVHMGPRSEKDPCGTCADQERLGIVPIGTLRSIGDSPCKSHCHCTFYYRVTEDGEDWEAGGGPLFEPVFGATG